ncbi:MAG: carboxypeptidase regulatory-like domain-containing protein [Saprospiraceae bacterium]|nr:carboxypeptidase regulatory-like domain-containing protein [Saprospiraceae bacterium]
MKTKGNIPFFTIDFTSCGHPVYESNKEGVFSMETVEGFACFIRIAKRGYANLDLLVDYEEIPDDGKTYNVFLSRSPNYFSGHLRDTVDGNLYLAGASVELRSITADQVQRVETNAQGEFSVYLTPNSSYQIRISHPDYHSLTQDFQTGMRLDGQEMKRFYLNRIGHKKIPSGLGTEVGVERKHKKLEGINYYSIQIIAQSSATLKLEKYEKLSGYGEIYVDADESISKIKVGKFFDRKTAEKVLQQIRDKEGYHDAFLTQYLPANKNRRERERRILIRESGYMVRLASYLNPTLFDGSKIEHLGTVTSVQKNEWTIMLLQGFEELDTARSAAEQVQSLGFKSAYVVRYEGSHLVKVPL